MVESLYGSDRNHDAGLGLVGRTSRAADADAQGRVRGREGTSGCRGKVTDATARISGKAVQQR
jgi:hypothetical protein